MLSIRSMVPAETVTLDHQLFVSAVHEHFGDIVLARNWVHVYL